MFYLPEIINEVLNSLFTYLSCINLASVTVLIYSTLKIEITHSIITPFETYIYLKKIVFIDDEQNLKHFTIALNKIHE